MRATSHNPLATALLLIPILALPMLAVFGVPQIIPVPSRHTAATAPKANETSAPEFVPGPREPWDNLADLPTTSTDPVDSAWAEMQNDATAKALAERRAVQSRAPSTAEPLLPRNESPVNTMVTPVVHLASDASIPGAPALTTAMGYKRPPQDANTTPERLPRDAAATPVPTLTWQSAVKRLNDLEIRNFRLEPGQQPEQFVFICSYTPPDNPRVSYRFEAEADEPLRAVERVLAQIDAWLAGR